MINKFSIYLKNFDWILFFSVLLLIFFGLAEIYSVALGRDSDLTNFKKQVLFIIIGLVFLFAFAFFDYHNLRSFSNYFYILGFLLLIFVLIFGTTIKGTRGWFSIAGFGIQPIEFVKIVLVIFLSKYFSDVSIKISPFKHLFLSGLGVFVLMALVIKQPDFGSAMILFFLWAILVVFAGFKKKYIFLIAVMLVSIFIGGWFGFFSDYQKDRITTLFKSNENSLSEGYNVRQATIAIGAGGLIGRGIGFGSQSQLKFLPESQTDFIFAVIAEELGFLGVSLIICFFGVFFYRLLVAVKEVNNDFGIYFILGVMSLIFIEMFINIGMNIGLIPVVGIALPFLSYGGSALISSLIMVGIAESIIIRSKIKY
jgi:rod shape determining protein RodA